MVEFENIAYFDLQKTGSSTIKNLLSDILDEQLIVRRAHKGIYEDFDRSKLCFISVREPLSLYISLFTFGAGSQQGGLYRSLCRKGREDLFAPTREAFARWLDFVLDPRNADLLNGGFGTAAHEEIGFLSYRLIQICVPNARHRMQKKRFRQPDPIRELFSKHIYEDYVRLEHLSTDLFAFLSRHSHRVRLREPLTTVDDLMARIPVRNASPKVEGLRPGTVPAELRQRVRDREWLFYEIFGYDNDPKGRPPRCVSGVKADVTSSIRSSGSTRRQRRRERRAER